MNSKSILPRLGSLLLEVKSNGKTYHLNELRVQLTGVAKGLLKVYDSRIDFGPVDIFYPGVSRKIILENKHNSMPLTVQHTASSSGITLNNGIPVVLEAGEKRGVPVEFTCEHAGAREETLRLFALNSELFEVELSATTEMVITCPVSDRIHMPTCNLDEPSIITFPIRNDSDKIVEVELSFPVGSSFLVGLKRLETSNNRRNMSISTDQVLEAQVFEDGTRIGIVIVCLCGV
jgi:hypothetical protein